MAQRSFLLARAGRAIRSYRPQVVHQSKLFSINYIILYSLFLKKQARVVGGAEEFKIDPRFRLKRSCKTFQKKVFFFSLPLSFFLYLFLSFSISLFLSLPLSFSASLFLCLSLTLSFPLFLLSNTCSRDKKPRVCVYSPRARRQLPVSARVTLSSRVSISIYLLSGQKAPCNQRVGIVY